MTFKSKTLPFLVVAVASLSTACGAQSNVKTASVDLSATADAAAEKDMHHAENSQYMKPGAPVRMSHDFKGFVTPGSSGTVNVSFISEQKGGTMAVQTASEGNLSLRREAAVPQEFEMKLSGQQSFSIPFSTQAPGVQYINLMVTTTDAGGQTLGRAFSIPIQVGDPAMNPSKPMRDDIVTTPEGEKLIVMDAEE